MRFLPVLAFIVLSTLGVAHAADTVDRVVVKKSTRIMELLAGDKVLRAYSISLGDQPVGHKTQEGDEKTPEGTYVLDWRNPDSGYHRSIHISYPNEADKAAAASRGVDPGGMIMIHGLPNRMGFLGPILQYLDWTDGCIALNNSDMDEVWEMVPNGTPIELRP